MISGRDVEYLLDMLPVWGYGDRGVTTIECCEWLGLGDWERSKGLRVLNGLRKQKKVRRVMSGRGWRWFRVEQGYGYR